MGHASNDLRKIPCKVHIYLTMHVSIFSGTHWIKWREKYSSHIILHVIILEYSGSQGKIVYKAQWNLFLEDAQAVLQDVLLTH